MLTTLYVVRHAHAIYTTDERNRTLSEKGYSDAKIVQKLLAAEQVDTYISSPYRRAWETIVSDASTAVLDERLRERQIAADPVEDFQGAIVRLWSNEEYQFPGGESNQAARKRGIDAFQDILAAYPGKRVAIGTHGNLMVLTMGHYDNQFDYAFWKQLTMPAIWQLTFDEQQYIRAEPVSIQK
ncbi:histidine phosphatase family protein [Terribacillus saccharophilus]|uniref:histidine phosphatase family protein n=1 Tax=Terribacillus saccharophilus TaxID=361277 RepID=UPI0020D10A26|nr:histidine phosphatase family protein [Terribacillus saccharophilus]